MAHARQHPKRHTKDWEEAIKSAQEALRLRKNSPYIWDYTVALARTDPDSAVRFCEKRLREAYSVELACGLVTALIKLGRFEEAETWIQKLQDEGLDYVEWRMEVQAEKGRIRLLQGRLAEAETELKKSFDMAEGTIHRQSITVFSLLGEVKARQQQPRAAEDFFKKAVGYPFCWDQNFFKNDAFFLYGRFLLHQNRPAEAQTQFENALKISLKTWHYPLGMALLAAKNGHKNDALEWLGKALDRYYFDEVAIREEPLFEKIRKTKRFGELLAKHFPEAGK